VKTTPTLFEIDDMVVARPFQRVAPVVVEATEDDVTGVAGIALFGELLDHLGLVTAADQRGLRPIGPGGYSGGECYRPVVELQLAGGDFISDVSLLKDEATQRHALPLLGRGRPRAGVKGHSGQPRHAAPGLGDGSRTQSGHHDHRVRHCWGSFQTEMGCSPLARAFPRR
jgi:hypothetical protein